MNKQPEITAATRKRIVDAFWELYAESPIEQIRIKEITQAAGINRTTFYRYFPTIYHILEEEERRLIDDVLAARSQMGRSDTEGKPIDKAMEAVARVYENDGPRLCLLTGSTGDPGFAERFKAALLPAFEEKMAAKADPRVRIAFDYGVSGLLAAFRAWFESEPRIPMEDFLSLARCLTLRGVPAAISPAQGLAPNEGGEPMRNATSAPADEGAQAKTAEGRRRLAMRMRAQ